VEQFPRRNAFRCVMSNFSARLKVLLIFQISFKMFAVFSVLCPILAPTKELTVLCWYNVLLFRGETPKYVLSCLVLSLTVLYPRVVCFMDYPPPSWSVFSWPQQEIYFPSNQSILWYCPSVVLLLFLYVDVPCIISFSKKLVVTV